MKKSNGKVLAFMRKNAVYLVLALCILAVGLSITFMLIEKNSGDITANIPDDQPTVNTPIVPDEPSDPVVKPDVPVVPDTDVTEPVDKPVTFIMPVLNATSINDYSATMVWNATMKYFTAHKAIDFFAEEGTPVLAVYDGTVLNVETSIIEGTTVTIDHGNGLYSIYNSLADGDSVTVGQTVKQGDVIGEVSITNRQEYKDGAHLHFEVMENGELIDPAKYLAIEEK